MSVSLVGAGPVGVTLAALLTRKGHRLESVISTDRRSAHRAARLLGAPVASDTLNDLHPKTTLLILSVPDEELGRVAARAAALEHLRWNRVRVFHTSGAQTSELLGPLAKRGSAVWQQGCYRWNLFLPYRAHIERKEHMSFDSFDLHPQIGVGVKALGYSTPTPIQRRAIPPILQGQDVLGLAQTGTGKTAAFVLPILQRLFKAPRGCLQALVIAPTRELSDQINATLEALGRHDAPA